MDITDSALEPLVTMALHMYTGEPCRICGRILKMDDIRGDGVVFAGYSADNTSRAAHKRCWQGFAEICKQLGLDWQTAEAEYRRQMRDDLGAVEGPELSPEEAEYVEYRRLPRETVAGAHRPSVRLVGDEDGDER